MNNTKKNSQNECDELAISIIDRICTPINEETKNNHIYY